MLKIEAFNDFWLDCYSTMLYSVLLSTCSLDKAYIYNNFYTYDLFEEKVGESNTVFYSVSARTDTSKLHEAMLKDKKEVLLCDEKEPVKQIKQLIQDNKLVLANVDLFHWIEDNYHYGRNHINHFSLVT